MVLAGLVALAGCAHQRTAVTPAASSAPTPVTATSVGTPTATADPLPIPLPASPAPHTPTPARSVTSPTPGVPAGTPSGVAVVITQADTGRTFTLPVGSGAELRLGGGLGWSTPTATPPVLAFTPMPEPSGTGYQAWRLIPTGHGTATIQSTGAPACQPGQLCAQYVVLFRATVVVP